MKKGGLHRLCFPHPMLAEGVRSATGHCTGHRGVRGLRRSLPASLPRTTLGPAQAAVPPRAPWRKPRRRREGVQISFPFIPQCCKFNGAKICTKPGRQRFSPALLCLSKHRPQDFGFNHGVACETRGDDRGFRPKQIKRNDI